MYIETIPNRNSPPAILLREGYREAGKVKKRTLANLSHWDAQLIEHFRVLLRGGVAVPSAQALLSIERTLPRGHVAAVLEAARACGAAAWFESAPVGREYRIVGHKWFFSAPICDAFLILAQVPGGL